LARVNFQGVYKNYGPDALQRLYAYQLRQPNVQRAYQYATRGNDGGDSGDSSGDSGGGIGAGGWRQDEEGQWWGGGGGDSTSD
jgi:hypothetical protein